MFENDCWLCKNGKKIMLYFDKECSEETIDRRVEMWHQPIKLESPPKTKKSFISSVRQMRPVIFCFQILSSFHLQRRRLLASEEDKFLSGVKSDRFFNLLATIWRNFAIRNLSFQMQVLQLEGRQNSWFYMAIKRWRWKIRSSRCGMTISFRILRIQLS